MAKQEVPWHEVEKYLRLGATMKDVCLLIGMSHTTFKRRLKDEIGLSFTDYSHKCQTGLRMSLRSQLVKASKHDSFALLFAAKSLGGLMEEKDRQQLSLEERRIVILEQMEKENDELFKDDIISELLRLGELDDESESK